MSETMTSLYQTFINSPFFGLSLSIFTFQLGLDIYKKMEAPYNPSPADSHLPVSSHRHSGCIHVRAAGNPEKNILPILVSGLAIGCAGIATVLWCAILPLS